MKKPTYFILFCFAASIIFTWSFLSTLTISPPAISLNPEHIIFTGDMMLGRNVETLMKKHTKTYPFEKISPLFQASDYVVTNLEGPINPNHIQTKSGSFRFSFPESIATLLKEQHIDFVSLGNNHTHDYGKNTYTFTRDTLQKNDIAHAGHPLMINEDSFYHTRIHDIPVIFVSYNQTFSSFDLTQAKNQISQLATDYPDNFIIVLMHWGSEYKLTSNTIQQNIAHELVDNGADLIVGHHPHVVQEIEKYDGKLIFYSLGNFIFDQYFSKDVQEGLLIKLLLEQDRLTFELLPTISKSSQPELMSEEQKKIFLEKLAKRSAPSLFQEIQDGIISISFQKDVIQ